MGAAVGFALAQTATVTFLIFTALALGLAAPYVLLTLFPGWMRFLPKPGAWMEVLKQACSVPIFATVIWLVWLYARLTSVDMVLWLLAAFLLLAAAGWALGRWPARAFSSFAALVLVAAAIAAPLYAQHKHSEAEVWQPWSEQAVAQARTQGHSVFVDFTAAWCLSCQFNERTVLNSTAVQSEMGSAHVVRLRADWTHYDPAITQSLAQLGRSGVPTYVVYPASPQAQPDVLPEALTQSTVLEALRRVSSTSQAKLHP
jgi:thiol:disulfide interchange protein DsbD